MTITIHCSCGKSLKVRDDLAGKKGKCPGCGKVMKIPPPAAKQAEPSRNSLKVGRKTTTIHKAGKKEETTIMKIITQPQRRVEPTLRRRSESTLRRRSESTLRRRVEPTPQRRAESTLRRRVEPAPQRQAESTLHRRAEPGAERPLRPHGLSLGVKYALFTTGVIALAVSILVILAYRSVRGEIDEEINKSGIMLVKVLSAFDFEYWENLKSKDPNDNPLARITSDRAEKMGIKTPAILNLVITNPRWEPILAIRATQIDLKDKREIEETRDKISIMEYNYYETGKARVRTRSFRKPIIGTDGSTKGYVHLFLSAKKIDEVLNHLFVRFFPPAFIAILAGLIIGFWMASQVTKPVQELMSGMQVVSRGNLDHQTYVRSTDEIGVLARMFNRMTEGLKLAHKEELKTRALERELNIAREVQANLLPKKIPTISGYDIAAYYRASKEVGGDYYDIIQVDENNLGFVVADVSGKGIPGSMVMTMTRSLIRMEAKRNTSPADILSKVNRNLVGDIRRGMFITSLYFILNLKSRTIQVSSAGHNPMVIWRGLHNTYELINPDGIALGFDRGPIFERTIKEQLVQLHPQDRIVIYTDGVVEAMNLKNEEFGDGHFYKLIGQLTSRDSKQFIDSIVKALDTHQGSAPQHDDITLLSVRVVG